MVAQAEMEDLERNEQIESNQLRDI